MENLRTQLLLGLKSFPTGFFLFCPLTPHPSSLSPHPSCLPPRILGPEVNDWRTLIESPAPVAIVSRDVLEQASLGVAATTDALMQATHEPDMRAEPWHRPRCVVVSGPLSVAGSPARKGLPDGQTELRVQSEGGRAGMLLRQQKTAKVASHLELSRWPQ